MTRRSNRTLNVRRAFSSERFGEAAHGMGELRSLVDHLHARFTTRAERRVLVGDKVVQCFSTRPEAGYTLLHFIAHVPEDPVAVVQHTKDDLGYVAAPEGTDFVDAELFVLVRGNDVFFSRTTLHETALCTYVCSLGERAGLDPDQLTFALLKRVHVDKLRRIADEGVASIHMDASAHAASVAAAEHESRRVRRSILAAAWVAAKEEAGFKPSDEVPDDEDLMVEVLLRFDGRGGAIAQKPLINLAREVASDPDRESGFSIRTLQGNTYRSEDVMLTKTVSLPRYAKSVSHLDVWRELEVYFQEIGSAPPEDVVS